MKMFLQVVLSLTHAGRHLRWLEKKHHKTHNWIPIESPEKNESRLATVSNTTKSLHRVATFPAPSWLVMIQLSSEGSTPDPSRALAPG